MNEIQSGDKERSLRHLARVAEQADSAIRDRDGAIRFAIESGASLREAAEAAGLSHMTVKRVVERAASA